MAYIANKPVRFDRTYAVGEVIPEGVIDPKMARRLADMGRILCAALPGEGKSAGNAATGAQNGEKSAEETAKARENGAEGLANMPAGEGRNVLTRGQSRKDEGSGSRKAAQSRAE